MLGGRDLAGRVLDQGGRAFSGEPTDLDAKTLGLRVELCQSARPPAAASKNPSRQRGAKWCTSTLASMAITPPWASPVHVTPISR
jgi:hypothetical protein